MGPSHQGAPSLPELGMQLGTWRVFSLLQAAQVPTLKRLSSYNEGGAVLCQQIFPSSLARPNLGQGYYGAAKCGYSKHLVTSVCVCALLCAPGATAT